MVDLGSETSVLLLAEFKLELDDLLLLAQVRNDRTQLGQFTIGVSRGIHIARPTGFCVSCLADPSSLSSDRFEVLVEKTVLRCEIFGSTKRSVDTNLELSILRLELGEFFSCRGKLLLQGLEFGLER